MQMHFLYRFPDHLSPRYRNRSRVDGYFYLLRRVRCPLDHAPALGKAGAGAATEGNPFMVAIVHEPLLHFGLKLLFALFTIAIANIMEHNLHGFGTKILKVACAPAILLFL